MSPNQRVNQQSKPALPVAGNRFGVDYKGSRIVGGTSGSRDRVPQINSNYIMKEPQTKVFDRLYTQPRSNSKDPVVPQNRPPVTRPPAHVIKPAVYKENKPIVR